MLNGDYSRGADSCFDGHRLHALPVGQEMARRIHVSADVGAGRDLREVADVAIGDMECLQAVERSVARPVHHVVSKRNGDIDKLATHEATTTTFLMPPASFESGRSACSMGNRAVISERTASGHFWTNVPRSRMAA